MSARKHKRAHQDARRGLPLGLIGDTADLERPGQAQLHYILRGKKPRPAKFWQWLTWTKKQARPYGPLHIARSRAGKYRVSTIFMGVDHGISPGAPVLFETMAYAVEGGGNSFRDEQYRYRTYAEAIKGHRRYAAKLANLREGEELPPEPLPPLELMGLNGLMKILRGDQP